MSHNPLDRSAAWTVLLSRGFFESLTGDADRELTTRFLDDFRASGATGMWEFAGTWTPDVTIPRAEYDRLLAVERAAQRAVMSATVRNTGRERHDAWLRDMNALAKVCQPHGTSRCTR